MYSDYWLTVNYRNAISLLKVYYHTIRLVSTIWTSHNQVFTMSCLLSWQLLVGELYLVTREFSNPNAKHVCLFRKKRPHWFIPPHLEFGPGYVAPHGRGFTSRTSSLGFPSFRRRQIDLVLFAWQLFRRK